MRGPVQDLPLIMDGVCVTKNGVRIIDRASLSIMPGAPTVIIGPNGAGKSSLLRLMMGLLLPTKGNIRWGSRTSPNRARFGIVFQTPVMLMRSAEANIRYALAAAGHPFWQRRQRATQLLELVGLQDKGARPARRLSGGERQRLALARALARDPAILLLDEPTASLDISGARAVEQQIRQLAASGIKIVMCTQDLAQARRLAGDVVFIHRGQIIESGPAERFFANPHTEVANQFLSGELLA